MKRIITLFAAIFALSGCSVSKDQIEFAEFVCEANGGIEWIVVDGKTKCVNGAVFTPQ